MRRDTRGNFCCHEGRRAVSEEGRRSRRMEEGLGEERAEHLRGEKHAGVCLFCGRGGSHGAERER